MEKLNNVVVENLNKEFGQELKKEFERRGFDTRFLFNNTKLKNSRYRFYGVLDGRLKGYTIEEVKEHNAKVITLEELKAIGKKEYPKVMWVGGTQEAVYEKRNKRVVFMEKSGYFIAWYRAKTIEEAENVTITTPWKYAKDIEETPEIEYTATNELRHKERSISFSNVGKTEHRLQQKWIGSDGTEKWEWIPYVD